MYVLLPWLWDKIKQLCNYLRFAFVCLDVFLSSQINVFMGLYGHIGLPLQQHANPFLAV